MAEIRYAIGYGSLFVGIDGESAADGYAYHESSAKALRFTSQEDCATFLTQTGPEWLLKLAREDYLRIVMLKDGVPA